MKRMLMTWLLACVAVGNSEARMYQWINTDTGRVQMSGKPPSWYRSGEDGPRVLVYENGKLLDDTRRTLAAEESQALREQALEESAERRRARIEAHATAAEPASPVSDPQSAKRAEDAATVARMKAIIAEWEQRQTGGTTGGSRNTSEPHEGTAASPESTLESSTRSEAVP